MQQERPSLVPRDLPTVIVQLQVMKASQQHSPIDIGASAVRFPLIDVVGLAV